MKTSERILSYFFLLCAVFSLGSCEGLYAQVTFPNYSPTAASSIAVCSGEETLIIDFTVVQEDSNGIKVNVKLADGVEYVVGTAVVSVTQGNAVTVAETNVSNPNEPVFTVKSADGNNVVELGTIVKLTIKRRAVCTAWSNAINAAETGFVFKDKVTVTIGDHSDSKESNSYSVNYPNLTIKQPAPQVNKQIGETIVREFSITNGSQNPTQTVYLSIEYPDEAYLTGVGAMTLQAKLGASGTYADLTPTVTNGKVRIYTLSGSSLGPDHLLTNGEIIYLKETFKLKTCAPVTVYKVGWGCSIDSQCEIKTTAATITMAAGAANITGYSVTGPNYRSPTFSLCQPFELTIKFSNSGAGGSMGAAFNINTIGRNDYYRPRGFALHEFIDVKVNGKPVTNFKTDGSELDLRFDGQFTEDPDGPGVGLDDVDGDGFYDDLPVGATITITVTVRLKCDQFTACNNAPNDLSDRGLILKTLYQTSCDRTSWIDPNTWFNLSSTHLYLSRESVQDASHMPTVIEKDTPFDLKIMTSYYSIVSSYNNIWYANPNTRYVVEIVFPQGMTMPPKSDIKWTNIKNHPIDGSLVFTPPINLPDANITTSGNTMTIVSPSQERGYVTLHGVKYDCTNNHEMVVEYKIREVFNYLHFPDCLCPVGPIMCNTAKRYVLGCDPPCGRGAETSVPKIERADNSLGWTDYTMRTRQSRSNISAYDLAKALYMDEVNITATSIQHGTASSLGARFVLATGVDRVETLTPLSADIKIFRDGVQIVSVDGYTTFRSIRRNNNAEQVIDWDFTSILPAGGLLDRDKVDVVTRYRVTSQNAHRVDTQVGREWFFYNSTANVSPIWDEANPLTCLILVPEIYIMGTFVVNGTDPHVISQCTPTALGRVTNHYARRFGSGAFEYANEYRPGVKIRNIYLKVPKSYTLNRVEYSNHRNHSSLGTTMPFEEINHTDVTSQGEYNIYKYQLADNEKAHFNITVENVYGAALKVNVSPTCASSAVATNYDKISYYVDYIDYYYYAATQPTVPNSLDIVADQSAGSNGIYTVSALNVYNRPILYTNKPSIALVNQSGEVELVGKTGEWKLRISNPSSAAAPYVWLALPTTSGLTIEKVTDAAGTEMAFTTYSGGKMYRLSEAGVPVGSALDYTIHFTYSGCSPIALKAMGGWNCSAYPLSLDEYVCSSQVIDLKLKPLPAAMELTEIAVPDPTAAATLCSTLEYIYSIQSTDNANVYSPTFSIFPEEGLVVTPNQVQVEYPAGSGNWAALNVVNNSVNLLQHPALTTIGYLKGLKEGGSDDNQRKILVKFYIKTECSFVSGKNFRVRADGRNACNQNAKGSGLAISTPPIRINGAIEPYTTSASTQLVTTTTSQSDCKAPKRVKVVQTVVGGETTPKAYLEITLPLGFKYVTGSYAPDNTHPGGVNASPAGTEEVTLTANGEDKIKINVKAGLTSGQSFAYTLEMKEDDDNVPACGNHTIEIVNVEEIEGLWCEGVQCAETLVVTGANKFEFELDKPYLDITVISAVSTFSGGKENLTIEYKVSNTSTTQPLKPGAVVTLFSDKDNNQVFSGGDVAVATQELGAEITNTSPLTQIMKVKGVSSSHTGNLVLTILPKDGCYCEIKSPMVTLNHLPSNYWIGGTAGKPNEWKEPNNWTNDQVPDAAEDVEFATEVNNPTDPNNPKSGPAKENLHLDDIHQNGTVGRVIGNLINDSDKDLVITTGNQLTINGVVEDNNPNVGTIVVKSSKDNPTGTLLFANPGVNQNVGGTVEFYNQGYDCADCGMYRRSWQYFGIPVNESDFPYGHVAGNETVNQWVEPFNGDKWRPAPYAPDTKLQKFKGYQITNDVQAQPTGVYSFKGTLCVCDAFLNLTRTSGVNYSGANLIGNSYTGAIDIKQGIVFPQEVEQTVYLFNTGTRDQWRKLNGSTVSGYRAGQYLSVPKNTAGQDNLPDRIPSMHSFLVKMQNGPSCTLQILYDKLLKNTTVDNGNGTQIAWRSGNSGSTNMPSLVMDVLGNESADRLWIFTDGGLSFGFDNGWDGRKLTEKGLSQLYAMSDIGNDKFQVAGVPELNNLLIGFDADKDGQYTLEFALSDHFAKGGVFLEDLSRGVTQRIVDGGSYSFDAKRGDSGARFRLSYDEEWVESAEVSVLVGTVGKRIVITNNSEHACQANVYTTDGKLLIRLDVKPGSKSMTEPLIDGAYVVSLQSPATSSNVRKVVVN